MVSLYRVSIKKFLFIYLSSTRPIRRGFPPFGSASRRGSGPLKQGWWNDHMNAKKYYHRVIDRLKNCYQFSHYVVAAGQELVSQGYDPAFPAAAEPVHQLENLTLKKGFQVHIPIVGERSQSVLMPIDFEVFLAEEKANFWARTYSAVVLWQTDRLGV